MKKYTFTADSMTVCGPHFPEGKTFPVRYELQDREELKRGQILPIIHVFPTLEDGREIKIDILPDDEYYNDAVAGVDAASDAALMAADPAEAVEDAQEPATAPAVEAVEDAQEPAAADPVEPAEDAQEPAEKRTIPEKTFIGTAITGRGYAIIFDKATERTRVILSDPTNKKARNAIKEAGFYYSPSAKSWNRKLTFRAYRAANALAAQLDKIMAA